MIQRIQSLYLSVIAILSLVFLRGDFLNFTEKTGAVLHVTFSEVIRENAGSGQQMLEKLLPLSVLIILIILISLFTLFLFKNRKIQIRFSLFLLILAAVFVIALIHISLSITSKFDAAIIPGFKMIFPVLILIFSVLAYLGIKKDDKLVKSYDRIR